MKILKKQGQTPNPIDNGQTLICNRTLGLNTGLSLQASCSGEAASAAHAEQDTVRFHGTLARALLEFQ